MTASAREDSPPPEYADQRPTVEGRSAVCPACGGDLQGLDAWRCPWVACRAWLRGTADTANPC